MATVYYSYAYFDLTHKKFQAETVDLIGLEPVNVFSYLSKHRDNDEKLNRGSHYLRCPAFADYCKNSYYVLSPYTDTITISRDPTNGNTLSSQNFSQDYWDLFVVARGNIVKIDDPFQLTMPPAIIFWSDESVMVELLPPILEHSELNQNIKIIPGTFNIGKWLRPLDFTFEIADSSKPLNIHRGQPIFTVRFLPENGSNVKLVRKMYDEQLDKAFKAMVNAKQVIPRKNLKFLYEIGEPFLKLMNFRKKKCPFSFFNLKK
jgi:hypothetical protein